MPEAESSNSKSDHNKPTDFAPSEAGNDASSSECPETFKAAPSDRSSQGTWQTSLPEIPPAPPVAAKTPSQSPHLVAANEATQKIKATIADDLALQDRLSRITSQHLIKLAESVKATASELPKPFQPIEQFKKATPCSAVWDGTDPKERCRYCQHCGLQVYDLAGLELPEAKALIFKRENRKNVTLFKRADGKFLTNDCPVAGTRKRTLILTIIGGSLLLSCLLGLSLTMPPPPKPATRTVSQPQNTKTDNIDLGQTKASIPTTQEPASQIVAGLGRKRQKIETKFGVIYVPADQRPVYTKQSSAPSFNLLNPTEQMVPRSGTTTGPGGVYQTLPQPDKKAVDTDSPGNPSSSLLPAEPVKPPLPTQQGMQVGAAEQTTEWTESNNPAKNSTTGAQHKGSGVTYYGQSR